MCFDKKNSKQGYINVFARSKLKRTNKKHPLS